MQTSAPQGFPMVIAALIGVLAVVFVVVRKLRDGGESGEPARHFPRRQANKPAMVAVALVAALGGVVNVLLQEGRARRGAGSVVADTLSGGGAAGSTPWIPVTVAIAVIAAVALVVMLLKLRDGSR